MFNIVNYWEMQIKTTMKYQLKPVQMGIIKKNPQTINARECVERREPLHCWWECKLVRSLRRTVWSFLKN